MRPTNGQLPTAIDAERALIGAITLDDHVLSKTRAILTPQDFADHNCRELFQAALACERAGLKPEPLALEAELNRRPNGAPKLTLEAIVAYGDFCPYVGHAEQWARLVKEASVRRRLLLFADGLAEDVYLQERGPDSLIELATKKLEELKAPGPAEDAATPDVTALVRTGMLRRSRSTISTGFPGLDDIIGGFDSGLCTCLVAPTNYGKTALALWLALQVAHVNPVVYCSAELELNDACARWASPQLKIGARDILLGKVPEAEILAALDPERFFPFKPRCTSNPLAQIHDRAREQLRRGRQPLVVVDFLQRLADLFGDDRPDQLRVTVGALADQLQDMSQELGIHVLIIGSVSRAYYGLSRRKNGLDDIEDPRDYVAAGKESGGIEYAASNFLYLDTAEALDIMGERACRIAVAKSKGPSSHGWVGLRFTQAYGAFREDHGALDAVRQERAKERTEGPSVEQAIMDFLRQQGAAWTPKDVILTRVRRGNRTERSSELKALIAEGRIHTAKGGCGEAGGKPPTLVRLATPGAE